MLGPWNDLGVMIKTVPLFQLTVMEETRKNGAVRASDPVPVHRMGPRVK